MGNRVITKGPFKGYQILLFNVMIEEEFIFHLSYKHCPIFKMDMKDVLRCVYERKPSLRHEKFQIYETYQYVR